MISSVFPGEPPPPPVQDLQDIKRAAEIFLMRDNQLQKTDFFASDLNSKIIVERCSMPLQAGWNKDRGSSSKSVQVICPSTRQGKKGWKVLVPVVQPSTAK